MYAGVQYGDYCFCGHTFGKYGQNELCDMNCSGNLSQICGGSWKNTVLSLRRELGNFMKYFSSSNTELAIRNVLQ